LLPVKIVNERYEPTWAGPTSALKFHPQRRHASDAATTYSNINTKI